jgi:hypothetical protein
LLVADLFWEKITHDWWLISQTNSVRVCVYGMSGWPCLCLRGHLVTWLWSGPSASCTSVSALTSTTFNYYGHSDSRDCWFCQPFKRFSILYRGYKTLYLANILADCCSCSKRSPDALRWGIVLKSVLSSDTVKILRKKQSVTEKVGPTTDSVGLSARVGKHWRGSGCLPASSAFHISSPVPTRLVFFPDWSGRTAAIQFPYTGPVQPGTAQNRMNSNFKSKFVVQSVWSGIPTGSTSSRSYNQKTALVENLTCFQIWIKNGK